MGPTHRDRFRALLTRCLCRRVERRYTLLGDGVGHLSGIEIGALDRPVVRPSEGNITHIDYLNRESLRAKYRDDPHVKLDEIVDSTAWSDGDLADVVHGRQFDYVIASHVAEHVPDLIWWLEQIRSVLKHDGTLRLALPDRRFTYDYLRHESTLSDLLDAYLRKARTPLPRMVIDDCLSHVTLDNIEAWRGNVDAESLVHAVPMDVAIRRGAAALSGAYDDVHCWVFTARSFLALFREAAQAGFLRFRCERFFEPGYGWIEFMAWLSPCDDNNDAVASWVAAERSLSRLLIARWSRD